MAGTELQSEQQASPAKKDTQGSKAQTSLVRLRNITNRHVELDLGRDKEIRLGAFEISKNLPATILETKEYEREKDALMVLPALATE